MLHISRSHVTYTDGYTRGIKYMRHAYNEDMWCVAVCCSVLQCVAVCCSVLQCVAVCCSVLQCVRICDVTLHISMTLWITAKSCHVTLWQYMWHACNKAIMRIYDYDVTLYDYGVATISRLLEIIGLFCKRAL